VNQSDYFKLSQEQGFPARCRLVGSCSRWAWSIYLNTYSPSDLKADETWVELLKRKGEIPLDFDLHQVPLSGESISRHRGGEIDSGSHLCPEVNLFSEHRPGTLSREAISSYMWSQHSGLISVEHKHFSQCLEFVKASHVPYGSAARLQEKSMLIEISTTMRDNQGPKYDLRGAQFSGSFAETVQGDQMGGTISNHVVELTSLADAADEIQKLLKHLEQSNPTATEAEKTGYITAMISPNRRQRFIGAIQSASIAALDELPYGSVVKALLEGWKNP
jgi:hypothetical protein